MADIQATLSKKLGPLPLWGWAAAAGGLVSVVYLTRRGAAQGAISGQPNVPYVPSPIIVTPQSMANGTSSVNPPAAPPAGAPTMAVIKTQAGAGQGAVLMSGPGSGTVLAYIPNGTSVMVSGAAVQGQLPGTGAAQVSAWYPVIWGGLPGFISAGDIGGFTGGQSGMGGASPSAMSFVPGSGGGKLLRHVGPHAHQQYLATGMGGGVQTGPWAQDPVRGMGGGGHARLQAVSQRTGVPMTRLMSLNPHQWQRGRRPRGHIHIA